MIISLPHCFRPNIDENTKRVGFVGRAKAASFHRHRIQTKPSSSAPRRTIRPRVQLTLELCYECAAVLGSPDTNSRQTHVTPSVLASLRLGIPSVFAWASLVAQTCLARSHLTCQWLTRRASMCSASCSVDVRLPSPSTGHSSVASRDRGTRQHTAYS